MTDVALLKKLVSGYSEDDTNFAPQAIAAIQAQWAQKKPKLNAVDPSQLNSLATFITSLKNALTATLEPFEVEGQEDFNRMTIKQQLRFQAQSRLSGKNRWVIPLQIQPKNITDIKMTSPAADQRAKANEQIHKEKLQADMLIVDFPKVSERLMPALEQGNDDRKQALLAALLLATGRRTEEILKTGILSLGKDMSSNGYLARFEGQSKIGLKDIEAYDIPLLAPFWLVSDGMKRVRDLYDIDPLSSANSAASQTLNNYTKSRVGLKPHDLRKIYAMATYNLQTANKPSLIGWVSRVLGHTQLSNAAYYTTRNVINPSLYQPTKIQPVVEIKPFDDHDQDQENPGFPKEEDEPEEEEPWIANSKPEQKRIAVIQEMMLKGIRITASSVRTHGKGSMALIDKVLQKNSDRIAEYNENLKK